MIGSSVTEEVKDQNHPEFFQKVVMKGFVKLAGQLLCRSLLWNKVAGCIDLKREHGTDYVL